MAETSGLLTQGDQIIKVNDIDLEKANQVSPILDIRMIVRIWVEFRILLMEHKYPLLLFDFCLFFFGFMLILG